MERPGSRQEEGLMPLWPPRRLVLEQGFRGAWICPDRQGRHAAGDNGGRVPESHLASWPFPAASVLLAFCLSL